MDEVSLIEKTTMRKIRNRLMYFLFLIYLVNVLDRINLSFAALQMNAAFGFDAEVYGLGAGMFFIGYLLLEIPSNFMLSRFGARIWIARITISWGVCAILMAFVYDKNSFYLLRFLLGAAEAGFAPGIVYFVSLWVPRRSRAIAVISFVLAIPASAVIGAPLSGWLLTFDRLGGLAGWQWMFILEGVPSVLLGLLALRILVDRPALATWLRPDEREWLTAELAREEADTAAHGFTSFAAAARDWRVWTLSAGFFCITMTTYGMTYWLPQIIKEFSGLSNMEVSLLTTIPFVTMAAGLAAVAWSSDRRNERPFHFAASSLIGAAGILIAALAATPPVVFLGLSIGTFGLGGAIGVFWPIPMGMLTGAAAVGGLAMMNMAGNSAGFVGSTLIGWIREHTQSFSGAFGTLSALFLLAAILVVVVRLAEGGRPAVPVEAIPPRPA